MTTDFLKGICSAPGASGAPVVVVLHLPDGTKRELEIDRYEDTTDTFTVEEEEPPRDVRGKVVELHCKFGDYAIREPIVPYGPENPLYTYDGVGIPLFPQMYWRGRDGRFYYTADDGIKTFVNALSKTYKSLVDIWNKYGEK